MNKLVTELQQGQFGFLHDFHAERSAGYLEKLKEKLGDKVIDVAKGMEIDRFTLYRWHLQRTMNLISALEEEFGKEVREVIIEHDRNNAIEEGKALATRLGSNSLEGVVNHFSGGCEERIIERSENEVLIKGTGCYSGAIGCEMAEKDLAYDIHCGLDKYFVEGYNSELGCEIVKAIMKGDEYCLHRIYKK